jgi:cytochrome oxidase Cu insertion factor (SCO1/SenC/PrrC family)
MMPRRRIAGVAGLALLLFLVPAIARGGTRDRVTGIVLMQASPTTLLVHHDAFGGMPAMTMTFAVPRGTIAHPGDRIAGDVDRSTDPWTLSALAVRAQPAAHAPPIVFLAVGDRVPAAAFVDQRGRRFTFDALHGRPYALTFMYTRCQDPNMCPLVSAKLHRLQTLTAGTPAALVEVSLDPAYDRPPVLARYGTMFAADPTRWHLLTGEPKPVLDFAARFRILERSAGPRTIVHSERLAIVDASGRIRRLYDDARWRADDVRAALAAATE